jgi:hypothetical protein
MAVRSQEGLARDTESLHMNLVRNPIPGPTEVDPIAGGGSLEVSVVIGILVVRLQQVMVYVLDRKRSPDLFNPHCLEFQHSQRPCGILQERMINPDGDFPAGNQLAFNQVGF